MTISRLARRSISARKQQAPALRSMSSPLQRIVVLAASLLVADGCSGTIGMEAELGAGPDARSGGQDNSGRGGRGAGQGGSGASASGGSPTVATGDRDAPLAWTPIPTARLSRLTHRQWENAVRALTGLAELPVSAGTFTGDPKPGRFDNVGDSLVVSTGLRDDYQLAAEAIADRVTRDEAALARLAPVEGATPAARLRAFIERFGLRAFRRPLSSDELTRWVNLAGTAPQYFAGMDAFAAGVRLTVETMLQSPHFLYRTELGTGNGDRVPLSSYEVAAKLSLTLTASIPDDELFAAAARNELTTREAVRAQAERLLGSPLASVVMDDFHKQLMHADRFLDMDKDPALFPEYYPTIGQDMREEAIRFGRSVLEDGGGVYELLTANHSTVNRGLARVYRLASAPQAGFERVALDPDQRMGMLTLSGFLASNAGRSEIDTIHRGVYVLMDVLCMEVPPPVPDAVFTNPTGRTNRERVNSNTGPGTCGAACHATLINPVGYAFEHYDALGRYRETDNGHPVDASASFDFDGDGEPEHFQNAIEMVRIIAGTELAHRCFAESLLEFAHGRLVTGADDPLVAGVGSRSLARVGTRELLLAVVSSDNFLQRLP